MGASCCGNSNGVSAISKANNNLDLQPKPMDKPTKRWDLLGLPHKGYKKMWADLLISVGSCDFSSEIEFSNIQKFVSDVCECYRIHNFAENMIFQDLLLKEPEVYKEWTKDHDEHVKELNNLVSFTDSIRNEPIEKRQEKGNALYEMLSLFISRDLTHMSWEQDVGMKALWKHFSDEELLKIVQEALKRYDTPEAWKFMCPFFIQSGGLEDNIEFIMIVKGQPSPPEEKESLLQLVKNLLPPLRLEKLKQMKIL